jgi:hypothetical protein
MIDRFWYNFFAKIDDICEWIADRFKRKKMTRKTNTVLIGLLGTILMGLSTWVDYNTGRTPGFSDDDPTRINGP